MARRKKLTPNQQAYQKEVNRIRRFIRRKEKEGFSFPSINLERPSRVTKKALEKIRAVRPKVLYELGTYYGEATYWDEVPAIEGRRALREFRKRQRTKNDYVEVLVEDLPEPEQKPKRKTKSQQEYENVNTLPNMADIVISNFKQGLMAFEEGQATGLLRGFLDRMIAQYGERDVAIAINEAAQNGVILTWEVGYKTEAAEAFVENLLEYFPEAGPLEKEEILEAFEQLEDWGSYE